MVSLLDDLSAWVEDVEGEPYDEPTTRSRSGPQIKVTEVYESITTKLRGILGHQLLIKERDSSPLDDVLLRLQFCERSIAKDANSLGDFELHYQPEADALLIHLQNILSTVVDLEELVEDKSKIPERSEEIVSLTEALILAFDDLSDATESVHILIGIHTGRGPSARIKKVLVEKEPGTQLRVPQNSAHAEKPSSGMSAKSASRVQSTVQGNLRPVACLHCRHRRSYCSKEKPTCSRCRDSGLTCIYEGARKILVNEAYLRELEKKAKALEEALSQRVSNNIKTKNVAAGEDEEDFEDEQPLLQPFTNLSLHRPSTSFLGPASSANFLRNVRKLYGFYGDDGSLDANSNFYEPGAKPRVLVHDIE